MMIFLVLGIVCSIILSIGVYNKYVRLKNLNQEGWSGIETYLQKSNGKNKRINIRI